MGDDDNRPMSTNFSFDGVVALSHWGVIRARGADAGKFLHSQLTSDMTGLGPSQSRLAGFCSAKGRLQASFVVWKPADDEFWLACSASVLQATLKRLSMFILRAQCRLDDLTVQRPLWGVAGAPGMSLSEGLAVWGKRDADEATVVRLPDALGVRRCLWIATSPGHSEATPSATPGANGLGLDAWRWLEVNSGIPIIEAATVDQFVPQMLNFELLGGVDFRKGCYPGQEVVARSQYRGTIKRRSFVFECDDPASPGQEVFHSAEPGQPAGMVVNAARHPEGPRTSLLVEVKLAALETGSLHLGSPQGSRLTRAPMPYEVPLEPA